VKQNAPETPSKNIQAEVHAMDVLSMAASGSMPDSYWHTDSRITRALATLTWSVEQAQQWAREDNG
jgi:hypothetical protein